MLRSCQGGLSSRPRVGRLGLAVRLAGSITLFLATAAAAQTELEGHAVGAIGTYSNPFASGMISAAAGGVEVLRAGRFGVGCEVGLFGGGGDSSITLSADGTVHLVRRSQTQQVVPFLGAGYTRLVILTDTGQSNAWHVRAGVNYWANRHRAVREIGRAHV